MNLTAFFIKMLIGSRIVGTALLQFIMPKFRWDCINEKYIYFSMFLLASNVAVYK